MKTPEARALKRALLSRTFAPKRIPNKKKNVVPEIEYE